MGSLHVQDFELTANAAVTRFFFFPSFILIRFFFVNKIVEAASRASSKVSSVEWPLSLNRSAAIDRPFNAHLLFVGVCVCVCAA